MWRDNRYFQNQFQSWDDISKDINNKQKLDDLMLISSLVSSSVSGIDNIYNYNLTNIIRLYNKYSLKYLNSQQQLFAMAPRKPTS